MCESPPWPGAVHDIPEDTRAVSRWKVRSIPDDEALDQSRFFPAFFRLCMAYDGKTT